MSDELYFETPNSSDFENWHPVAIPYRIWSNACNRHIRIYCNNGTLYAKLPNSNWKKIITVIPYQDENFSTTIDLFLPVIKDKE